MSGRLSETPGFVALEGGDARVELVPSEGGRIRSLHLFGREWLLGGDEIESPRPNAPLLTGGGWDECAPCAGGGPIPEWVKEYGGRSIPLGGETRLQQPEVNLATDSEGHHVTCVWRGDVLPWVLTRRIRVRPDGGVEAQYEALTTGREKLPFLWSALMLFPMGPETRLGFPAGSRFRISSLGKATPTGALNEVGGIWPRLTLDGKIRELSSPWSVPRQLVVTGWVDLPSERTVLSLRQGDEGLTISCDGAGVPHCGFIIDRGGKETIRGFRLPFRGGGTPVIALRPSLGAPDRYADALGDWHSVTWLMPGEPRRWTMTIRGGTL